MKIVFILDLSEFKNNWLQLLILDESGIYLLDLSKI